MIQLILDLLLTLVFGFATFVIELIPDLSFDSNFWLAFESVGDVMDGASYLLPMGTFFLCMSVFFLLHNTTFIISIVNWIIRKIPTIQ